MIQFKSSPSIYWFYLVCFIGLLAEWLLFTFSEAWVGGNNLVTIAKGAGDCAMLLIPFWFIPNKYKGWILIISWLASTFFLFNLWYCRFWDNLIPITFYRLTSNLNSDLINSVKALIKASDCIMILTPIGVTLYYFLFARKIIRKEPSQSKSAKYLCIGVTLVAFLLSQTAYSVTTMKWNRGVGFGANTFTEATIARLSLENPASLYEYSNNGLSVYGIQSIIGIAEDLTTKKSIKLNDKDLNSIAGYFRDIPELTPMPEFFANSNKNLILILVESLNAYVINKEINGHPITPFMNAMLDSAGTIAALNIIPQVKTGCSNDGQLLTNTGLLPLNYGVSSMEFGEKNIYPNLVEILDRPEAVALFGDTGYTWNQTAAFQSYGFKNIHTFTSYESEAKKFGRDKALFNLGEDIIPSLKQPFFVEFVTFSMHTPFTDKAIPVKDWLKDSGLPIIDINYLNMTHYFDQSLKSFVEFLKKENLYDNTVIVIVSDHSMGLTTEKQKSSSVNIYRQDVLPMMFMALNAGTTIKRTEIAGQVNVFPTILQIMNRTTENYHGMDRSLLDPALHSAVSTKGEILGTPDDKDAERQRRSFNVADSLQRGDYFRQR